jgi:hypothetical protein
MIQHGGKSFVDYISPKCRRKWRLTERGLDKPLRQIRQYSLQENTAALWRRDSVLISMRQIQELLV